MTQQDDPPTFRIRVVFGPGGMIGPGKADLLDRIRATGSIAAAGREMGMSYKRAWQLVETLNAMFRDPLVERARGGAKGGGAKITAAGEDVLAAYRALEDEARRAGSPHAARLQSLLRPADPAASPPEEDSAPGDGPAQDPAEGPAGA